MIDEVYRGRFKEDKLWVLYIPAVMGVILFFLTIFVLLPISNSVSAGSLKQNDLMITLTCLVIPFAAAVIGCIYLTYAGMREQVRFAEGAVQYRAPFYSRKIPAMDIEKFMIFEGERPIIIYYDGDTKKRQVLPRWGNAYYIDELIRLARRANPSIEVVDMRGEGE
jgi:hypothetical protein